jgi:hypothetical protein
MPCEERLRLTTIYFDAIEKNNLAGNVAPDPKSEAWREATKDTRTLCEYALAELNQHRREHGC